MKYLFVFLTIVSSLYSLGQSKKEQIAILTNRLDSLNREYIKDTAYLNNTINTIDREYSILSDQYDKAQQLIKKKSATISENKNTIKSLNSRNIELNTENMNFQKKIKDLDELIRELKLMSQNSDSDYENILLINGVYSNNPNVKSERYYHDNGQISYDGYTLNGKAESTHGLEYFFYENGKIKCLQHWNNGKREGLKKVWHENGKLKYIGVFVNGVAVIEKCYNDSGLEETEFCSHRD